MIKNITVSILLCIFVIPCLASAFKQPDAGQNKCYQAVDPYAEIPCDNTGQDGAYNINPMSYTDNGNGTVTDNNTGLMWQKCSTGQDNDSTCSGTAAYYNWYQASGTYDATYNPSSYSVCGSLNLGSHTDWRLPTKKELMSIVDYGMPYLGRNINTTLFPNTVVGAYISYTTVTDGSDGAWYVHFSGGNTYYHDKSNRNPVRCVRDGQTIQSLVDNGNGTVTDKRTGLMWQQGEDQVMKWDSALSYCEGLSLGEHSDWRLPNIKELESLSDDQRNMPAIDTSFFPNAHACGYWSSTTINSNSDRSWGVDFRYGYVGSADKYYGGIYVRCVRGGQSGSLGTLSLNISGTGSGVVSGSGFRYGESVVFSTSVGIIELFDMYPAVNLRADHSEFSQFNGWSGACTGTEVDCVLTMNADKSVTASFKKDTTHQVLIDSNNYPTIMAAYQAATSGKRILIWGTDFSEVFTFNKNNAVTLAGGYDSGYKFQTGYTTLNGPLIIQSGSLTVENLVIR